MKRVPILFVDVDSTIRHGRAELGRPVTEPEDVTIYPAALEKLREAKRDGWRTVAITNQERVALGTLKMEQMEASMEETSKQCEGLLDLIMICTHHPDAPFPEDASCWCRKPKTGAVMVAVESLRRANPGEVYLPRDCLFVGNQECDRLCAENAGVPFRWAFEWRGEESLPAP